MAESFSLVHPVHEAHPRREGRLRVLVTGAAGNIGSYFAQNNNAEHELRLLCHDRDDTSEIKDCGEVVTADVTKLEDCKRACQGIDVVLHLAADPSPSATWDSLLPVNIVGTYNVFAAAKHAGVRRVVYASSIHAVGGYESDRQVAPNDPVNPGDLYGVTKCFGEAMGRYMAEQEGVQCIAIRIGAFQSPDKFDESHEAPQAVSLIDSFVSKRDLNQLLRRAAEAEHLRFAVVHGLSDNRFKKMSIDTARDLLGYDPQDDLTEMNPELAKLRLHGGVLDHDLGGGQESGLREDV